MSSHDILAGLSYLNAGLQNTVQLIEDRKEKDPNAFNKFFFNLSGSAMRIGAADHMARHGNYWGYTLNSFVPYTDARANAFAMMSAPFMTAPFGGFGFGCTPIMPFGGFWGGGHHHHGHFGCHHGGSTVISIRC